MLIQTLLGEGDLRTKLIYAGMYLIAIVLSLSAHEWAHAFVAHLNGDNTARNMGRMTLNPLAHIDPAGLLMLLIVGFGWAKPVPVNSRNYRNYRLGEATVSLAGIFMNLLLAFVSAGLAVLFAVLARTRGELPNQYLQLFLDIMGIMNCALAIFNLLPLYPLDGSHIFDLLLGKLIGPQAVMWLHRNGRFLLYGFLILSVVLSRVSSFSLVGTAASWLYSVFWNLFASFVG